MNDLACAEHTAWTLEQGYQFPPCVNSGFLYQTDNGYRFGDYEIVCGIGSCYVYHDPPANVLPTPLFGGFELIVFFGVILFIHAGAAGAGALVAKRG